MIARFGCALATFLLGPGTAFACDGPTRPGAPDEKCKVADDDGAANPAQCAREAELLSPEACAWTTTMMAQRVLEQGVPWTYVGRLVPAQDTLPSRVAAPYTVGPDDTIHVIANQVLDELVRGGDTLSRVHLAGKTLEVEGITYFVAVELSRSGT